MKIALYLLFALMTFTSGALAQGNPDFFWDDSQSWGANRGYVCRMGVAPTGAQAFLLIEQVLTPSLPITSKIKYTTLSPAGVHVHAPAVAGNSPYGLISRTGQMVVYYGFNASSSPQHSVMLSTDFGQTFSPLTLPTTPLFPYFAGSYAAPAPGLGTSMFGPGNDHIYNSVIGEDDKFYLFYFTQRTASWIGSFDRYALNMLVVDATGAQTHSVISQLSSSNVDFAYINVVSTHSEIVAVVSPGRTYRPRGGTVNYSSVPMAVVINTATQNVDMINFGGTMSLPLSQRGPYRTGLGYLNPLNGQQLRMLSSDGENIFMLNGATQLPTGRYPIRLREFPKNPSSYGGFFVNTELTQPAYQPTWEPYMDLQSPAMDYGTFDTAFLGSGFGSAGGSILDFTSKWGVGGVTDHSADIYFYSAADFASGVTSVKRMRIPNPNTPPTTYTPEYAEDFPTPLVASIFGPPQSNYEIPYYPTNRSHWGVEGSVASTYCYRIFLSPIEFVFHLTDFS